MTRARLGTTAIVLYKPTEAMPGASSYELAKSLIGTFALMVLEVEDPDRNTIGLHPQAA